MKFVYPWMLLLLSLVPVAWAVWVFLRSRAERRMDSLVAQPLRSRLAPRHPALFNLQAALLLAGMLLVVFAAARPQWGRSAQKTRAKTRNVVVALDVSRSMLAADVRPNRLERAKADIADLIDSLEGDRCALVAFRRTGALLCPLTTDHAFLRSALEGATPESAARGETDLGAAIRTSLSALDPAADDHNAIILVSDGGDLRGGVLDAARTARQRNVPVFTVGIGDPKNASPIPDASGTGFQQYKGQTVKTKLEEAALVSVAKESSGRYVPLATAGTAETTLGAIYRRFLRQVAAKEQAEEEEQRATERFGLFLVPGLLLVLLAACLSRGRFAARSSRAAAALLALAFCLTSRADESTNAVESADGAVTNAAAVVDAASYVPPPEARLSDREVWNRGYDLWKAGDVTNALAVLEPLLLSRTHGPRAAEVTGAIHHERRRAMQVQDPVAAEKEAVAAAAAMQIALRASPQDQRAARNFARAVDDLEALRENARVAKALKGKEQENIPAALAAAKKEALDILRGFGVVYTNSPAEAVAGCERLATRVDALADRLIVLKSHVAQNVTNEQQAAQIVGDVEATRDAVRSAVDLLEDMSPDAAEKLSYIENAFHRYWKPSLVPPAAIAEGLRSQTNACIGAERENGRDWQQEALDFTRVASAALPGWAQQACAADAPAASNTPPFTAQLAQEVAGLADEVAKMQEPLVKAPDAAAAMKALAKTRRLGERCGMLAIEPPAAIAADLLCQTNAYAGVVRDDEFDNQRDALDYTRVFRAKFPSWAQRKEQEIQQKIQQGATNTPPFTKEQQKEIAQLALAAERLQTEMTKAELPPKQLEILKMLERIRELLPKDNGGGQNQQQNQQNQQQQQDQQQQQNQQQNQQQDQQQDQAEPKEHQTKEQDNPKDDKEVEDLLRKAQERSNEHENDKRNRARKAQLPPNERDW